MQKPVSIIHKSQIIPPVQGQSFDQRRWLYIGLVSLVYLLWFTVMTLTNSWSLFAEFWPISITMAFGSFVAGATPLGGATVAFPVFTKVLQIPSTDARTFGLMIQAVGMSMAGVLIISRRIKILPHVIGWVTVGGALGTIIGAYYGQVPPPMPKILFTFAVTAFGVVLALARWGLKWKPRADIDNWNHTHRLLFTLVGFAGGLFAANTGSGTDMFAFVVMTLAFGINEKISTPTTVIIMALNSIVGFFVYGVMIGDVGPAWNYWLVAIPIVIVGAPLGALVASLIKRDYLIIFTLLLIGIELTTTLWLVPFDTTAVATTLGAVVAYILGFGVMLYYQHRTRQIQEASS